MLKTTGRCRFAICLINISPVPRGCAETPALVSASGSWQMSSCVLSPCLHATRHAPARLSSTAVSDRSHCSSYTQRRVAAVARQPSVVSIPVQTVTTCGLRQSRSLSMWITGTTLAGGIPLLRNCHGECQPDYTHASMARTVYTTGMFAIGREWRGWASLLKPRASGREPGNLSVIITDEILSATFPESNQPLQLHVAMLGLGIETAIECGENRNRTLRQEFVVLAHKMHGASKDGQWIARLPMVNQRTAERLGLAVWVSEAGKPAPLQATGGWLDESPQIPLAEPR